MGDNEIKELLNKNLAIVEKIEKQAKVFSKSTLIISILDVLFGVLALFTTSLSAISLFTSMLGLTAITISRRIIQVKKITQLNSSLKGLKWLSLAWYVEKLNKNKKWRTKKVKNTKSTKLQKILTSVLAVFGVGGVVVGILPQFTNIATQITTLVSVISESVAVVSGIWLSQTSDKVLTEEEIKELEDKKLAKDNEKKLAKAKAIMEQYEEAKKIVEANKQETSNN